MTNLGMSVCFAMSVDSFESDQFGFLSSFPTSKDKVPPGFFLCFPQFLVECLAHIWCLANVYKIKKGLLNDILKSVLHFSGKTPAIKVGRTLSFRNQYTKCSWFGLALVIKTCLLKLATFSRNHCGPDPCVSSHSFQLQCRPQHISCVSTSF